MYEFINPYSFVPFGNDGPETKDKKEVYRGTVQKDLLTGWLDVDLSIKTPLIIPDGAHPGEETVGRRDIHKSFDFLKMYNPETGKKEYVVPGSELRGLIRSAYESVTNSCVPFLLDDKPMSQRVPLYASLNRRGLLGYSGGRWILYGTDKTLEEVIVIPLYEVNRVYYAESIAKIRNNEENKKTDSDGKYKYGIMNSLDSIENTLRGGIRFRGKNVVYNARLFREGRNWSIEVNGQNIASNLPANTKNSPADYLFVKADGSFITTLPGTEVRDKGWIQYNVPVNPDRIYHVAYLKKAQILHEWAKSTATGAENRKMKDDRTYAEAYKQLRAALHRDGTSMKNVNYKCNSALLKALDDACNDPKQLVPVYYFMVYEKAEEEGKEDKELVYMSGAASGRIGQRRKWKDIMAGHTPCGNTLCPACRLFGTTADGGMKGHVRFTDAYIKGHAAKTSVHTLQILSTPRTTAFEFYLRKPTEKATYWNFDFYGETETDESGKNSHTTYHHLEKALPRGRKMYWHHKPAPDADQKNGMNNTMECMDEGSFRFKVYFDQISREQLMDLIWVINLGENRADGILQHKLGHAKPLGYGSVKLTVGGGAIRRFTRDQSSEFSLSVTDLKTAGIDANNIVPSFDLDSEEVTTLLKICRYNAVGNGNVDYPRTYPNGKIYEWFAENRTNSKDLKVLPEPKAENLILVGGVRERRTPNRQGERNRAVNRRQVELVVQMTRVNNDRNDPNKKLGYTDDGMIFGVPRNAKPGRVRVTFSGERNGRKFYNYVGEA